MNFSETTPAQIYEWIKKRDNGDSTDYYKVKDDTQEAIDVLKSLYGCTFVSPYKLFHYLYNHLCMRVEKTQSFYRAFIVLKNDDIITLRLSQHFSTRNSVKKAIKDFGKADVEYHLIIGRTQSVNPKKDIYYDRNLKFVSFKIRDIDLADFNDNGKRRGILDEIIKLLTDGNSPSSDNNETINRNMKKTIRLTESALRGMIKEAVIHILNEGTSQQSNEEIMSELVSELQKWGTLDTLNDRENYKKWDNLSTDERLKVLQYGKFTGMLSNEQDLDFANLYRAATKESMVVSLQDQLQNKKEGCDMEDTNHYILKFKGIDKVVFSEDLDKPLNKTQIQKLEYISAGGGLSNYRYWVGSQEAKEHLMKEMGFIEYIDGRIVN